MYIDDEPEMIKYVYDAYSEYCEVATFSNPILAYKFITENKDAISVVITDHFMVNITGCELIKCLKLNGITIPCVLVSGDDENKDIIDLLCFEQAMNVPSKTKILHKLKMNSFLNDYVKC